MGSWNGTCFLSNLPILCNSEIVALLIIKNNEEKNKLNGYCYSYDEYCIMSPFIKGTYNDYGLFDITNKSDIKILTKFINKNCKIKKDSYNYDINNNVIQLIERGLVYYDNKQINFIMMHKNIFNDFINIKIKDKWYRNNHKSKEEKDKDNKRWVYTNLIYNKLFWDINNNVLNSLNYYKKFIINDTNNLITFFRYLEFSRKILHQTSGNGSQNDNIEVQKELAKSIITHSDKICKYDNEED